MMGGMDEGPGRAIVRTDVAGTAAVVLACAAGAASSELAKFVLVPVAAAVGTIGVVTFVWSYFSAVGKSRTAEIAVTQLYGVAGDVAPTPVKRTLRRALWTQVVVAVAVMVVGFTRTTPSQFNWAACAVIAPMFGLGLNGLWVAHHGTFGPRIVTVRPPRRRRPSAQSRDSDTQMEQNSPHG